MWLYVPGLTGSHSVPGLAESNSGFEQQSRDSKRSATSKATPTPPLSLPHGWKKKPWTRLLSGTILQPSTAALGVGLWIASLRASRVNPSASQGAGEGKTTSDGYGPSSLELSKPCSRPSFSLKTSQESFPWEAGASSPILPDSASMRSGVCFPRPRSEQTTSESDGSYWPTPRAEKIGGYSSDDYRPTLLQAVKMFPTPRPCTGKRSSGMNRTEIYRAMMATPIARDARTYRGARRAPKAQGSEPLVVQVGGTLNPTWVEWLMGFPTGWTACDASETPSSPRKPHRRSKNSRTESRGGD